MAIGAKRICTYPGCQRTSSTTRCEAHPYERPRRQGGQNYGRRWRNLRNAFIKAYPLCKHCQEKGRIKAAQDVDHIDPFDGPDDPRKYDWTNLQSLCRSCHNKKTAGQG